MTDDVLLDALDRLRGTGPEFDGFLANHGPMAAEALVRLGAADAVTRWVDAYRPRLDAAPEVVRGIGDDDWRDHLGEARLFGDWTAYLRREARETDWRTLLLRWWPRLLPGLAASATHGVIRTAHAVRSLRAAPDPDPLLVDEVAQGLAFWAARYQTVPGDPGLAGPLDAVAATAALPRLDPDVPSAGPGISGRLAVLDRLDGLDTGLDAWGPRSSTPDGVLDELIAAAARVLAARDDAPIAFCHAVTAPAAVRLVLPELPEPVARASVVVSWQVVGGIVAAFAVPRDAAESVAVDTDPQPLRERLVPRAVEHGDEHVIKLTEAVGREYRRTGDTTLLVAADRFRGRMPPP